MKLNQKTVLIISLSIFLTTLLSASVLTNFLVGNLTNTEGASAVRHMDRAVLALKIAEENVQQAAKDFAVQPPLIVGEQMAGYLVRRLAVNIAVLCDHNHRPLWKTAMDLSSGDLLPFPDSELGCELAADRAASLVGDSGLLQTSLGPVVVAVARAPKSEPGMTIILGKLLDQDYIDWIDSTYGLSVSLLPLQAEMSYPSDLALILPRLTSGSDYVSYVINPYQIGIYALVEDIYGQPAFALRNMLARTQYSITLITIGYTAIILLLVGIVQVLVTTFLINKTILKRVIDLQQSALKIGGARAINKRVAVLGTDEIGGLGASINAMLESLEKAQEALQEEKSKTHALFEIISASSKANNLDDLLEKVLETAIQQSNARGGMIHLLTKGTNTARLMKSQNLSGELESAFDVIAPGMGTCDLLLGSVLASVNLSSLTEFDRCDDMIFTIPLVYQGDVIGFFSLIRQDWPIKLPDSTTGFWIAAGNEIGAGIVRIQKETAIRENEAKLRNVIEHIPESICVIKKGQVAFVNYAMRVGLGFTENDSNGRLAEIYQSYQAATTALNGSGKSVVDCELTIEDAWGIVRHVIARGTPIQYQDDMATLLLLVDITNRKEAEDHLKYVGEHDLLTKIYNRNYFETEVKRLSQQKASYPFGIIIADANDLKVANDLWGHASGDQILIDIAAILASALRQGDTVARIGGDEFVILIPNASQPILDRIIQRVSQAIHNRNHANPGLPINVAIGGAVTEENETFEDTFKRADKQMYANKQSMKAVPVLAAAN